MTPRDPKSESEAEKAATEQEQKDAEGGDE